MSEIVRLSTKFGILTEYTSFLAAEEADHARFRENTVAAARILDELKEREVGAAGWAQSANNAGRRGATRALRPPRRCGRATPTIAT